MANPCALIGSFSVRILQYILFPWKQSNPCIFVLEQSHLQIQNLHFTLRNRVPYNKQLTNRACSGRTGEYWPLRSVSKQLIFPLESIIIVSLVKYRVIVKKQNNRD